MDVPYESLTPIDAIALGENKIEQKQIQDDGGRTLTPQRSAAKVLLSPPRRRLA
jgi:hypothetical protein